MFLQFALIKAMIEWKEHEHELDDIACIAKPPNEGRFEELWPPQVF
jgi:hypothetical protein